MNNQPEATKKEPDTTKITGELPENFLMGSWKVTGGPGIGQSKVGSTVEFAEKDGGNSLEQVKCTLGSPSASLSLNRFQVSAKAQLFPNDYCIGYNSNEHENSLPSIFYMKVSDQDHISIYSPKMDAASSYGQDSPDIVMERIK